MGSVQGYSNLNLIKRVYFKWSTLVPLVSRKAKFCYTELKRKWYGNSGIQSSTNPIPQNADGILEQNTHWALNIPRNGVKILWVTRIYLRQKKHTYFIWRFPIYTNLYCQNMYLRRWWIFWFWEILPKICEIPILKIPCYSVGFLNFEYHRYISRNFDFAPSQYLTDEHRSKPAITC